MGQYWVYVYIYIECHVDLVTTTCIFCLSDSLWTGIIELNPVRDVASSDTLKRAWPFKTWSCYLDYGSHPSSCRWSEALSEQHSGTMERLDIIEKIFGIAPHKRTCTSTWPSYTGDLANYLSKSCETQNSFKQLFKMMCPKVQKVWSTLARSNSEGVAMFRNESLAANLCFTLVVCLFVLWVWINLSHTPKPSAENSHCAADAGSFGQRDAALVPLELKLDGFLRDTIFWEFEWSLLALDFRLGGKLGAGDQDGWLWLTWLQCLG